MFYSPSSKTTLFHVKHHIANTEDYDLIRDAYLILAYQKIWNPHHNILDQIQSVDILLFFVIVEDVAATWYIPLLALASSIPALAKVLIFLHFSLLDCFTFLL